MKQFFLLVILLASAPVFFFMDGSIPKDVSLSSEQLAPAFIATTDRRCRTSVFVFHQCSYKYELNGEQLRQSYHFLASSAPETLILLRGNSTGRITSDVGQNYLTNRILTLFALPLFCVFAILKGRTGRNSRRAERIVLNPGLPTQTVAQHNQVDTPTRRASPSGKPVFGKRR